MNGLRSLLLKSRVAPAFIVSACFALSLPAFAQEKPAPPETSAPAGAPTNAANSAGSANPATFSYDVVSIKPCKLEPGVPMVFNSTADGLSDRGADLINLIMNAFHTQMINQIEGLPDWANMSSMSDERWAIEAKMDEDTAAAFKKLSPSEQRETRRSMMLQVLVDRFNLKYHKETRVMPRYNLVVAKNGPKFKETPPEKKIEENYGWAEISGDNITMSQIIGMFGNAGRYVADKTGLTGRYTLSLKWNPIADQNSPAWFADQYPQFKGRPDLFIALEEQLGLKLDPAKGPVDVYVIDHVEKPSPD